MEDLLPLLQKWRLLHCCVIFHFRMFHFYTLSFFSKLIVIGGLIFFQPFKIHLVEELNEDDYDQKLDFCRIIMDNICVDSNLLNNIIFSDEATFILHGNVRVDYHNCWYWLDINPLWYHEAHINYSVYKYRTSMSLYIGPYWVYIYRQKLKHWEIWCFASKTYHTKHSNVVGSKFPKILVSTRWCRISF